MAKKKSNLKWILLAVGAVVILLGILLLVGGIAAFFMLQGPNVPEYAYDDSNVYVEFPSADDFEEGGITNQNTFFTFNYLEGRSYALNYYDNYASASEVITVFKDDCALNPDCDPFDEFSYDGKSGIQFSVFCKEEYDEILGWVDKCVAAADCNQKVVVVSVTQDWEDDYGEFPLLPEGELKGVLGTAVCK